MRLVKSEPDPAIDPVAEMLVRLWQAKLRSIRLLEEWIPATTDFSVRAGLQAHLAEERRHQRVLGNELNQRGGRRAALSIDHMLDRPFTMVLSQADDLSRVRAFHHGIKASTARYYMRLIPMVDAGLGRILEQIARDEERHIRWAETRLEQRTPGYGMRHMDPLLLHIEDAMEAVWAKPWRRLVQSRPPYPGLRSS